MFTLLTHSVRRSLRVIKRASLAGVVSALVLSGLSAPQALADTSPAAGKPATVSAQALPTVQIESSGVVYAQVVVGNTVYATGKFSTARPAGAAEGTNTTPRANLLAYDITTGNLISSFNHSLNDAGRSITASPDGTILYVGGSFTTVDGAAHPHLVEINLTNNTVVSSFTKGASSTVATLAATNTTIYAGGDFSKDNTGTQTRSHLIAFSSAGALLPWAPNANGDVHAMTLTKDGSKVIVGGSFSTINAKAFHGTAALSPSSTGAPLAWASSSATFPIRDDNVSAGITSLSTDGAYIYLSAFNYSSVKSGGFEGTAALSPNTGAIVWANDCHGDTYSAFPINGVLYSTGHAHDCESIGAFPETYPKSFHAALAQTTTPLGTNVAIAANLVHYPSFAGVPKSTQLAWYPDVAKGTATGLSQAAWSISGNADYVVLGGEFPSINGVAQQGLARFGKTSVTSANTAPIDYNGSVVAAAPVASDGSTLVVWPATYDRDNSTLSYTLYRDGTAIKTISATSHFWNLQTLTYRDTGLVAGSTHTYKVIVSDGAGNSITGHSLAAAGCHIKGGTTNSICAGEKLTAGQALYSLDGKHHLSMQADGNLVLYNSANKAIWVVRSGVTYSYMTVQVDGNFVVYSPAGKALWNSKTNDKGADHLNLSNNGNLVLYTPAGKSVWSTNTAGK